MVVLGWTLLTDLFRMRQKSCECSGRIHPWGERFHAEIRDMDTSMKTPNTNNYIHIAYAYMSYVYAMS